MIACIFDFETTGLDRDNDVVTEFGAIRWDPYEDKIIELMTARVSVGSWAGEYTQKVVELTGIPKELIHEGIPQESFHAQMGRMIDCSDMLVAHNASFDCSFLRHEHDKPVMDTMSAIPPSKARHGNSMSALTYFHNIKRPHGAHRAMLDALDLLAIVRLYNWDLLLERQASPVVKQIVVDMDFKAFDATPQNKRPAAFGFAWDSKIKKWYRNVLKCDLEPAAPLPFNVKVSLLGDAS